MVCLVLNNVFWIRFASSDDNEKRIVKRDGKKEGLFNDCFVEQFASLTFNNNHSTFNNNHSLLFIKLLRRIWFICTLSLYGNI